MQMIKVLGVRKDGIDKWFKFYKTTPIAAQLAVAHQGYEPLLCRKYRTTQVPLKYLMGLTQLNW